MELESCIPPLHISYTAWIKQKNDTEKGYKKEFSISKRRQDQILQKRKELQKTFRENKMALCVGAGVTAQYVGTWFDLIGKLISERFVDWSITGRTTKEKRDFFSSITVSSKNGISATELGQYLLLDDRDKCEEIDNPLYAAKWKELYLATQIQSHMPDMRESVVKAISKCDPENNTFDALLTLCNCMKSVEKGEYAFRHIINYNYDTMFESCLNSKQYRAVLCTKNSGRTLHFFPQMKVISSSGDYGPFEGYEENPGMRCHYHVHGCLERDGMPTPVVFSESSYDDLGKRHYQWCNQVQAELCMRFPLLFVGFSGNDPNFRRLLKEMGCSHVENKGSFLFMRLSDVREIIQLQSEISIKVDSKKKKAWIDDAVEMLLESIEYYYKKTYNIHVLWYQEYSEIAKTLLMLADECDNYSNGKVFISGVKRSYGTKKRKNVHEGEYLKFRVNSKCRRKM